MREFAKRKRRPGPPAWGPGGGAREAGPGGGAREAEPGLRPSQARSRSGPGAWGGIVGFSAVATVSAGLAPDQLFRLWVALGPRAWPLPPWSFLGLLHRSSGPQRQPGRLPLCPPPQGPSASSLLSSSSPSLLSLSLCLGLSLLSPPDSLPSSSLWIS